MLSRRKKSEDFNAMRDTEPHTINSRSYQFRETKVKKKPRSMYKSER